MLLTKKRVGENHIEKKFYCHCYRLYFPNSNGIGH